MNIITTSKTLNGVELYRMTKNAGIRKMKEAVGTALHVSAWVIYNDTNNADETKEILSILDSDTGIVFATNSPTFIRAFREILDILSSCGEQLEYLQVIGGTSKAGRSYVTAAL